MEITSLHYENYKECYIYIGEEAVLALSKFLRFLSSFIR